ncbi:shikimate dehydrogenase [Aquibacillus kalidii]|uniref:shikimate dehydrogenase n=1 Tax=Aquibacillus kalidii TaxID=2762597 RepID=UPI001647A8D2|nr:shikimate dehydrogenase [Aquibacillus kalidii]
MSTLSLGLIGFPIQHSLSPWIHNHFMKKLGINGEYVLYETKKEHFAATIDRLKEKQLNGFNVTVPYKQDIINYLDELDPDAARIGAVNTVTQINGKWKGYNTDGMGYVQSVRDYYPDLFQPKNRVLILGAGGAARGIYRALVQEPFSIVDIANRTFEKAQQLAELKDDHVETNILSFEEAQLRLEDYDYVVQTTSVGMNKEETIISLDNLKKGAVVSDIVYQPLMTSFLKEAHSNYGKIHQGHAMLLYQAQLAFQIWSGKQFGLGDTLKLMEERLRGNE